MDGLEIMPTLFTTYSGYERPAFPSVLTLVAFSIGMIFPIPYSAAQETEDVEFNDSFLRFHVDASRYSQGNPLAAGVYRVDIYLNERWIGRQDIRFELPSPESTVAVPCFDMQLFNELGINTEKVTPETLRLLEDAAACLPLGDIIDAGESIYDDGEQRLNFNVPQANLVRQARGYVSPKYWDDGVTAATLRYDYMGYRSSGSNNVSQTHQYLGLLGGFNWQSWRLYYRSTLNKQDSQGFDYQNIATYAERAVPSLYSKLTLGDSVTNGQVFDSLSYRGVELGSDDRMYPDSLRGYAPVVRGIARTNARVVVRQMGQIIYETTVPAGPFVIDDLYPTGQGGNLYVTVTEADGSTQSFTVAFTALAELLRPGMTRYSLMAGEYRDSAMTESPPIVMGTVRHGFSNVVTGSAGAIAAEGYAAASLGTAFNTPLGALAFSVTQAQTKLPGKSDQQGQSIGVTYAKTLPETNTSLTIASYHYSSSGFYSPSEALRMRDYLEHGNNGSSGNKNNTGGNNFNDGLIDDNSFMYRRRNQAQLSVTQGLPEGYGSFYVSVNAQDYWGTRDNDMTAQFGYNNNYKTVTYNISLNRVRNMVTGDWDNQLSASFSLPLGASGKSPRLSTSYLKSKHTSSIQTGVSGSAGADNQYNYGLSAARNNTDENGNYNTLSVNGSWLAPYATMGGSYSRSNDYDQASANLSGGVVAYRNGVVFASNLGETVAIIEAPDAAGARVANYSGMRLNRAGKAVVPTLNPYRQNDIEIDPLGLSADVELKNTSLRVAPTAGAVALVKFDTSSGNSVMLVGRQADNQPLPFGAVVKDDQGLSVGYIAQGGQAMLRVAQKQGSLQVIWGEGAGESCRFDYRLPEEPLAQGEYKQIEVICK